MKLNQITTNKVKSIGVDEDGIDCSIDQSKKQKLFELISKNIYSNPIGSLIREITSNCFDSHIEAGVQDAVVVSMGYEDAGHYISFIDVGTGLSPDRIKNVYSKYLSSTKENTNDQIGYWGLGSKSPLAYQDMFHVITRFNGIEYLYIVHKGEEAPRVELMYEIPTEERNGTTVKVFIKDGDHRTFQRQIESQLCYFENVYFNNCEQNNNYQIIEGEHFLYRPDSTRGELHVVLGKVAYPLNWSVLKISRINIDVALKFSIGELKVTPSREDLVYDNETIDLIKSRIEHLRVEFQEIYNKNHIETDNFEMFLKRRSDNKFIEIGGYPIYVYNFIDTIPLIFSPWKNIPNIPNHVFFEYKSDEVYRSGSIRSHGHSLLNLLENSRREKIVRVKGELNRIKTKYIAEEVIGYEFFLLRKNNVSLQNYKTHLNLVKVPKSKWRELIILYQKTVRDYIVSKTISYDKIEIDPEWLQKHKDELKRKRTEAHDFRKSNKKVLIHEVLDNVGYYSRDIGFLSHDEKISNLQNFNGLLVYGNKKDEDLLFNVYVFLRNSTSFHNKNKGFNHPLLMKEKAIKVINIAKTNEKYLNYKAIRIEDFMKGTHKTFRRIATALKIEGILEKYYPSRNAEAIEYLESLYKPIAEVVKELDKFLEENYSGRHQSEWRHIGDNFKKDILRIAEEGDLWDKRIYHKIKEFETYFTGIEVLKFVELTEESFPHILAYAKKCGKKLNPEHYSNNPIAEIEDEEDKAIVNGIEEPNPIENEKEGESPIN